MLEPSSHRRYWTLSSPFMKEVARLSFYVAIVATLVLALGPPSLAPVAANDKLEHFVGFFALAFLGVSAFGVRRALSVALALMGFGAAIEILQMLPLVGRDGEILDWVADALGILSGLALIRVGTALQTGGTKV